MHILDMSFKRSTYQVELYSSLIFESTLGIAAVTNARLHGSMDKPASYWQQLRDSASGELAQELEFCEKHQTWKMLLQLLHTHPFASTQEFVDFVWSLEDSHFKFLVLPYLESGQEAARLKSAQGDHEAAEELIRACQGHPFFPEMIQTVTGNEVNALKRHLTALLQLWDQEVTLAEAEEKKGILERDLIMKKNLLRSCTPEEVVLRAAGVEYKPEAGVSRVLLIPHVIYRPWTIEANMKEIQIFYYPVSEASLTPENDPYQPPGELVQLYKALGDDKRLRALKLICEQDRSLKELTELLGMGKTTVHHHLAILRGAGLVRVKDGSYSWNQSSLDHHDQDLHRFLGVKYKEQ
ncbi:ArsR/SmtB family transcription factor [Paenibacillus dokdonensis]|uniref:ArsR/SmtB family transcription factor n=1 Tax=Paenibacillus dokdonensis TaxID=2567944 RepID=UPI0010A92E7A|nr:metalloregulator ArsR/SmtB family transcription factor [Paenibacillus dokdonensis]